MKKKITLKELRERGFDVESVDAARGEIALFIFDNEDKIRYCSCGVMVYLQKAFVAIAKENKDFYDLIVTTAVELTGTPQGDDE